jgi:NitT/TauT family transport system permease protein
VPLRPAPSRLAGSWSALWPKLAAFTFFLAAWQAAVWSAGSPEYVLPAPAPVFSRLAADIADGTLATATAITLRRAALGYSIALVIGVALGLAVARNCYLRTATGSLIAGLQTMPSVAWFPLAILLFKLSEQAILFVIVLGAAPAIANGLTVSITYRRYCSGRAKYLEPEGSPRTGT